MSAGSRNNSKLKRQNTIMNDIVANLRASSGKNIETDDPNDFGVCLLKDSPYRILRVSYKMNEPIIINTYNTNYITIIMSGRFDFDFLRILDEITFFSIIPDAPK